jgi:SOS-response transcriptional repressor LexA
MMTLTARQQEALRFIAGFKESLGVAPTLREIADGLGLKGQTAFTADWLVRSLEERGAIRVTPNVSRGIDVLAPIAIPRAPDGEPLHFVRIEG